MTRARALSISLAALAGLIAVSLILGLLRDGADDGDPSVALAVLEDEEVMFLDDPPIYLVWNEGDPLALSADAQHLGDEVWYCTTSGMFESPAHGEKFDRRGYYFAGPAEAGLDRYPLKVVDDRVVIDAKHPNPGPQRDAVPPLEPEGQFCEPLAGGGYARR